MLVDIIITNTEIPTHAQQAITLLSGYAKGFSDLDVQYKYYCTNKIDVERSGVDEHEWLLFNAASRPHVVEIDYTNLSNVRSNTFAQIKKVFTNFSKTTSPLGIISVDLPEGGIRGVTALYYKVHNNVRKIRYMDSTFSQYPRVALLVPMSLRGLKHQEIPILKELSPSLQKTFSHASINRGLYLGIDADEDISDTIIGQIDVRFTRCLRMKFEGVVKFPAHWRNEPTMAKMYNALYERAIMDGYDFAIQLQDDTRMETPMWDRLLASLLCLNYCAAGAYSPHDRYDVNSMRNVMVSQTHYDIFGYFCNDKVDDMSVWFTKVPVHCSGINPRVKTTNTIRNRRRTRNGTSHVYKGIGKYDEDLIRRDHAHFKEVYLDAFNLT